MTSNSSVISGSTTGSPLSIHTSNLNASAVDTTAKRRLSVPLSPISARLSSSGQTIDALVDKHQEALQLIESNPEGARVLFLELIRDMPKTEANLLFLADCKIGLAYTYPENSNERNQAVLDAKGDLGRVYENRETWDSLGEEEKICKYKQLRTHLQQVKDMSSPFDQDNFIEFDIQECTRQIPLLSDYYDKINEGTQGHLTADEAEEIFTRALQMIEVQVGPEYLLARAIGTTEHASTLDPDDNNPLSAEAAAQAFAAYAQKKALFTNEESKLSALNLFIKLFNKLSQLIPVDSDIQTQIQKKLEECQTELTQLQDITPKSKEASPPNSPRVTKEPVDHWKTVRLFIAFGFAAVVIVGGAFVLGRRYITQLDFSK